MKRIVTLSVLLISVVLINSCSAPSEDSISQEMFNLPTTDYNPHTWYHWMNGHISKSQITDDLASMKEANLGGFTLFNTQEGIPAGHISYGSSVWWSMLTHTMQQASKNKLRMSVFNASGWSTTAGSFVKPEYAMQEVVWTEKVIDNKSVLPIRLTIPVPVLGLHRDMKKDTVVNQRYYMPRSATVGHYKDLKVFAIKGDSKARLKKWTYKTGRDKQANFNVMDTSFHSSAILTDTDIVDVTEFLSSDNLLDWKPTSEGKWTVVRMGYQPTGRSNHPASIGGKGLEIDKMSAQAAQYYWDNYLQLVVDSTKKYIPKYFEGFLIDSYEAGHQTWTHGFEKMFSTRNQYAIDKYLLTLTGRVLKDVDATEKFLWDYRKTISETIEKNYYKKFYDLCDQHGVKLLVEPYGNFGNTNDYDITKYNHIPLCEWWALKPDVTHRVTAKLASSAANLYDKKIVDSEAFTGSGKNIFKAHPGSIKSMGDYFMTKGVNRFTYHTFVHDPYNHLPGLGLGNYGTRFDTRNTWWKYVGAYNRYVSRCQYMLRQGETVADVLYYGGQDAPLRPLKMARELLHESIPDGYDYDICNTSIFLSLEVKDGLVVTPNGRMYEVVVLPNSTSSTIEIIEKTAYLVQNGAQISGQLAAYNPSLTQSNEQLVDKIDQLNGTLSTNKLEELLRSKTKQDFNYELVTSDQLSSKDFPDDGIVYIHKKVANTDVYFISNQHDNKLSMRAKFRVGSKYPSMWNPKDGSVNHSPFYEFNDDQTTDLMLNMDAYESIFVVFTKDQKVAPLSFASFDEKILLKDQKVYTKMSTNPLVFTKSWTLDFVKENQTVALDQLKSWTELSSFDLQHYSGDVVYKNEFKYDSEATKVVLDLGKVGVIAEVSLNGKVVDTLWCKPYQTDVSKYVKKGVNSLKVTVTNTWLNRVKGDFDLEDDVKWTTNTGSTAKGKGLAEIPTWVVNNTARPNTKLKTFYGWKWPKMKESALMESGLLENNITLDLYK